MWAMIVKEFRQLRRDRRTLAMMIVMPVILLIVFGYAASFDVKTVPTVAAGPQGAALAKSLGEPFDVVATAPDEGRAWAETQLRDNTDGAAVAVIAGDEPTEVLIDGSQLFSARAALAALSAKAAKAAAQGAVTPSQRPTVTVLYNPGLKTSNVMIPGLCGVVLVFIGTIITALGVVRERQSGTLEQLAVMPLRPRDVFLGKIVPYFGVAALDLAIVVGVGVGIFGVPFRGSYAVFALGAILFLFVTLGLGVLISSVSENQGEAIQLSMMVILPQILLSGLIFPLSSIAVGVRWISYLLPLTYFNQISRGVMLRAEPIGPLWQPFVFLALLGLIVFTLASLRFRSFLAPAAPRRGKGRAPAGQEPAAVAAGRAGTEAGAGAATGAGAGTCTGAEAGAGRDWCGGTVPGRGRARWRRPGGHWPGRRTGERGRPSRPGRAGGRGERAMTAPSPQAGPAATATQDWWGTEEASVRYGDKLGLDHVTFRAVPGQVGAVVGGDGAGRTTLLRCLAGAHAVSSGRVRLPAPLRIGYLSAGSGTYPDLSVDENLAFRASAYQMPGAARERSQGVVERAGLAVPATAGGQLSGGMRQKPASSPRCCTSPTCAGAGRAHHRRGPGQPPTCGG
jgi:ABC-2 type transport system permease protein